METTSSVSATHGSDDMLTHACRGLQDSLAHMPECAYREYVSWVLSSSGESQHRDAWLQVSGVAGIVRLYTMMFGRLLKPDELAQLAHYTAPLIVQQTYEVISDNLALGLAQRSDQDATFDSRREVVSRFNDVVIDRLRGRLTSPAELLSSTKSAASGLSLFEQSHSPHKHKNLADAFVASHDGIAFKDLEHCVWPALVASCSAISSVAHSVMEMQVAAIVREGLISRYAGVSALLSGADMDLNKRIEIGTGTILVQPTLAFFAGIIGERVRPLRALSETIRDGSMVKALEDTALLVRLLNDVGTDILLESDEKLRGQFQVMRSIAQRTPNVTLRETLLEAATELGAPFTRIHKDLVHREFNVCLDQISAQPAGDAIHAFERAIEHVRRVYRQRAEGLKPTLSKMNDTLGDSVIGDMMGGFLKFHAMLYVNDHNNVQGEFAV